MFLPIGTDRRLRRTPVANLTFVTLNVLVFLLQGVAPALEQNLLLYPTQPTLLGFFGSAFMHADIWHLGGNMLFLYIFGNAVNDKLGNAAYTALYLGGALAAGLLHVLVSVNPVLGASGAVSTVTGAYLVLFPRSRVSVLILLFLITFVQIPSLWLVGAYFALDIFWGFYGGDGVARFAHIGGTLFGFVSALSLLILGYVDRDQMDLLAILRRYKLRRDHAAGIAKLGQSHTNTFDIVRPTADDPKVAQIQDLRDEIGAAIDRDNLREAGRLYGQLLRVDPDQVLSMQRQLDVANQLAADGKYPEAASAYEHFLRKYDRHDQHPQTQLMLGLIYARYLGRPDDARRHLQAANERLEAPEQQQIAREELESLPA